MFIFIQWLVVGDTHFKDENDESDPRDVKDGVPFVPFVLSDPFVAQTPSLFGGCFELFEALAHEVGAVFGFGDDVVGFAGVGLEVE